MDLEVVWKYGSNVTKFWEKMELKGFSKGSIEEMNQLGFNSLLEK